MHHPSDLHAALGYSENHPPVSNPQSISRPRADQWHDVVALIAWQGGVCLDPRLYSFPIDKG